MNFSSILNHIATIDPEVYERTSERRSVIRKWMRGAALTALPFAIGSLFNKAYGKNTGSIPIEDVLNFALKLEYLEAEFYNQGILHSIPPYTNDPLIPEDAGGNNLPAIRTIYRHEAAHVGGLRAIIQSLGKTPIESPKFDFSGGKGSGTGPFQNVFIPGNYGLFLAVAQTLEDTGVRAYKGAAPDLMSNNVILTAALRIHSVEARHAAHIRSMRRLTPSSFTIDNAHHYPRPWVISNNSDIAGVSVDANYEGEQNTQQANFQIIDINGKAISQAAASASFDEPLDMVAVNALVDPFIVP